jgi:hypothetical protein
MPVRKNIADNWERILQGGQKRPQRHATMAIGKGKGNPVWPEEKETALWGATPPRIRRRPLHSAIRKRKRKVNKSKLLVLKNTADVAKREERKK